SGYNRRSLGVKSIAAYLNDRGITMRGRKWKLNLISKILSNRAYLGEYVFNKKDSRAQKIKPESEWMTIATGKGGRYRYYKCSSKIRNIGQKSCTSGNVSMEKLDEIILRTVGERVFTPERVK